MTLHYAAGVAKASKLHCSSGSSYSPRAAVHQEALSHTVASSSRRMQFCAACYPARQNSEQPNSQRWVAEGDRQMERIEEEAVPYSTEARKSGLLSNRQEPQLGELVLVYTTESGKSASTHFPPATFNCLIH